MLQPLKPGDLIYICSPAKAIEAHLVANAVSVFEQKGYRVEVGKNALKIAGYFAGSKDERLTDLQYGLNHTEVKAIVCTRGGYGCVQLLDELHWDQFEHNPKWLIGFSDITNLHLEAFKRHIPSLHATMPLNYPENSSASLNTQFDALEGKGYSLSTHSSFLNREGSVHGEIIGGNLSILYSLLSRFGAEYYQDKILYLEDVGEHLYQFDRMFHAFTFAGIPQVIKGLVVGGFTDIKDPDDRFGETIQEIILKHFGKKSIPIGFGFPAGHMDDNQAILLGKTVEFRVTKDHSSLLFPSWTS